MAAARYAAELTKAGRLRSVAGGGDTVAALNMAVVAGDFTYVSTWTGMVHVAFVFDVFSRRILGWQTATTMTTPLVLDALEMALWPATKTAWPPAPA